MATKNTDYPKKETTLTNAATTYWYAFPGATRNVLPQPKEAGLPIPTVAEAQTAPPTIPGKQAPPNGNNH